MNWGTEWDDKKPLSEHPSYKFMQAEGEKAKDNWVTHTSDEAFLDLDAIIKARSNKVPTHDPYTNPGAHVYYSCKCGKILDPGTKSFAQLNNAASEAGWKIRFGDQHYEAHCVECGKEVE